MKTSMLGERQRRALVGRWPSAMVAGVRDEGGGSLRPGDIVRLPLCVRHGSGPDIDVPGTVMGFAFGKDGMPSVVVDAPAWASGRVDPWRTWIVDGDFCNVMGEGDALALAAGLEGEGVNEALGRVCVDGETRERIADSWARLMASGVRTRAGVAIQPGDLVRLPRNVARNRGSQLHAAGLCLGYAVGMDGSPCVVADAVGEDVPTLTRWRTWVVRGGECMVIDSREAWRLEAMYDRSGRLRPRGSRAR